MSSQELGHAEPSPRVGSAAHNLPAREPPPVHLRLLPVDEAEALLIGRAVLPYGLRWHEDYPMAETLDALAMTVGAHRATGWAGATAPRWWMHQIVVGDLVVGDVGFHGPPAPRERVEVEIGYHVVPALRRQGIATRACQLVVAKAWADGAMVARAEVAADNPDGAASRRVLLRAGFGQHGPGRFALDRPPRSVGR